MTKLFTIVLFIVFPVLAWPQENVDLSVIHRIKQEELNHSQLDNIALHLIDESGPRLTNSPGLKRAADWAVAQLTSWGLKNAAIEPWGGFGKGWDVKKCYAAMTVPYYAPLICFPKAWTGGTTGPISGPVVLLNITTEDDIKKYEGQLDGKIVLVKSNADMSLNLKPEAERYTEEELEEEAKQTYGRSSRRYSPEVMAQYTVRRRLNRKIDELLAGQKVILVIRGTRGKYGTLFTSNGASYKMDAILAAPELEMVPENSDLMARLIEGGIDVKLEADIQTSFYDSDSTAYNVVAEIPGSDKTLKSELVMLGGHLDSWHAASGATDDGVGCVVMMEAVRILQQLGLQPKRTIRIALWSAEEQGLFGSRYYVKNHFADQADMIVKPDHSKLSAYFNIDNGAGRIRGIYLQGNDMARPIFEKWFEPFKDMVDNTTISIQNTGGTDHLSFDAVGLPGFQFIQDPLDYGTRTHHTNMDTRERLIKEDMQQMAIIVASFVYNTAQRDQKIPRKPLPEPRKSDY